jgi:hypothetical protein
MKTLYALVWGQCTDIMKQRIEGTDEFETLSEDRDGLGLLKTIKNLVYNFQSQKYLPQALHESARRFYNCIQTKHMTTQAYMERSQNMVDVIEYIDFTTRILAVSRTLPLRASRHPVLMLLPLLL